MQGEELTGDDDLNWIKDATAKGMNECINERVFCFVDVTSRVMKYQQGNNR